MMRRIGLIGLMVAGTCFGWSWGATGHEVVAAIAWQRLDLSTKVEIAHILMRGDSATGTMNNEPFTHKCSIPSVPNALLTDTYLDENVQPVFVLGSVWPDDIKRGKSTNFDSFIDQLNGSFKMDHVSESEAVRCKSWHYVDYPLELGEDGVIREGKVEKYPYSPSNAVAALNTILKPGLNKIPRDGVTTPDKRAVYLYFVEHLVGDLHQPLHCTGLFGAPFPESGDAGGNLFKLDKGNLHGLWDNGVDQAIKDSGIVRQGDLPSFAINVANRWIAKTAEQPRPAQIEKQNPLTWVVEGKELAISSVYEGVKMGEAPSDAYLKRMASVSRSQAILAGYRLAEWLKTALK